MNILQKITVGAAFSTAVAFGQSSAEVCDAYFRSILLDYQCPAFSAAIAQHGRTLYYFHEKAGGASQASVEAPSDVRSITKILGSVVVMQLVESGKISLHDKVRDFIPEYPFDDVQIIHLLTHTSGTKGAYAVQDLTSEKSAKAHTNQCAKLERYAAPGEVFQYYSMAYDIIADVVERIEGASVGQIATERILKPLGMNESTFPEHAFKTGLKTTTADLLKFGNHLLEIYRTGKRGIVSRFSLDTMMRDYTGGKFDRTPAFFQKSETRVFSGYFGDINSPSASGHAGASGCFLLLDFSYDTVQVLMSYGSRNFVARDENFKRANSLLLNSFAK